MTPEWWGVGLAMAGIAGGMLRLAVRAGKLEQRVDTLETAHESAGEKIDRLLDEMQRTREAVIRVETKLEERRSR